MKHFLIIFGFSCLMFVIFFEPQSYSNYKKSDNNLCDGEFYSVQDANQLLKITKDKFRIRAECLDLSTAKNLDTTFQQFIYSHDQFTFFDLIDAFESLDTRAISDMSELFELTWIFDDDRPAYNESKLPYWDVSHVKNMRGMFF